jgi:[ribosomal protein S5]-alanine N-acetyltransferase
MDNRAIRTRRLELVLLDAATLRALLGGERPGAAGVQFPQHFPAPSDTPFLAVQLERVEASPHARAWCVRAIVRRQDGAVVGHCGFHGPPAVIGRAEVGYTVFPEHRRQGYAAEAVRALVDWAQQQGEPVVVASIAPGNEPSLRLAGKLGFRQVGVQLDPVDGEELVLERVSAQRR